MSRTHRTIARLVGLALTTTLVGAALASASPAMAAGDKTMLYIDGEPGSVGIGVGDEGKSFVIVDDADYDVSGFHEGMGWEFQSARVLFREAAGVNAPWGTWNARFGAPEGTQLVPGTYPYAVRSADPGSSDPELDVSGNGEGCNTLTGEFTINEIEWEENVLHALSASFRQRCDCNPQSVCGSTYGEVRFNATAGIKALEARPWSLDFGQADSGTYAGAHDITVKAIGDRNVSLGPASLEGPGAAAFSIVGDDCSGAMLSPGQTCVVRVSSTPTTNKTLKATLRIVDDTYRGKREVPLKVKGLGSVDATADVSTFKFYPVADSYKDSLAVKGTRTEATRVDIEVTPDGSDRLVATGSVALGTGGYKWVWRGKDAGSGQLAPAGKYDIVTTLTAGHDTKTVTKTVSLSHDWVSWKKKTVAKLGRKIALWGWSGGGKVTFEKSVYRDGVRLNSGKGFAAVIYALPVAKSDIYGWMSFEVEGKSANKRKALVAVWNPSMGAYKDLGHYDAGKKIGPWKKWWKTGVNGVGRVKRGKVRMAVMNWKGLGGYGKSIFDIKRVRLTYKVGTLHKAPGLSFTLPQKPAWVVGPRVEKVAPSKLPTMKRAPVYVPPPIDTDEPAPAADETEAAVEPAAEAATESGSEAQAEPVGEPEAPQVDAPALERTPAPEPPEAEAEASEAPIESE